MIERVLQSSQRVLELSLIIPVMNEAGNIPSLLDRIDTTLVGIVWEVIIVDDNSPDGTAEIVRKAARLDSRVRIVRRIGRRGLASAVIEGMMASAAPVLAVMDGDLQHDETILPSLYRAIVDDGCDLAVGTRYAAGGSTDGWDASRECLSRFATWLSRRLLRTELSDPMSGYFAVRREAVMAALPRLSAIGFKILMDIVASSPEPLKVAEIPYVFRTRLYGESKFDLRVAQEFFVLLLEKTFGHSVPIRFLMFAVVGIMGLGVHLTILGGAIGAGLDFRLSQSLAVGLAMTGNFFLNNALTFRDMRLKGKERWRGLLSFYAVGLVGAIGNIGVGAMVYRLDGLWWLAGLAGAAIGVVWNYAVSSSVTWRVKR